MSRPLRIAFPGAIYHLTSRGNARGLIFLDDDDRQQFLRLLAFCVERFRWICHAYCLMDNHYHLLIEMPEANLQEGMRQLNGVYTQKLNRRHARVGHVFQGRYKAILIDRDSYLLELCRYIVLNPVRANMVQEVSQYPWSSYQATLGTSTSPDWLQTEWLLSQFGKRKSIARKKYAEFVAAGLQQESLLNKLSGQVLLGEKSFFEAMRPFLQTQANTAEIPKSQRILNRPELSSLLMSDSKQNKQSRDDAIRNAHIEHGYSMAAIARYIGLHYSSVSKIVRGER